MDRHHLDKKPAPIFVRKLAATSSLAAGAGLGLLGAAEAEAAVVPFNPPGGPVTVFRYPDSFYFDIDGDATDDFYFYDVSYFGDFYLYANQPGTNLIMKDGGLAAIAAPGGSIGPDTTGWSHSGWLDNFVGTRGYAGVMFDIPGGSPHFGYLDIAVAADRSSLTLYGGAYESLPNTPIQTPIPEPISLVLLASGAAGLAARRRRRGSQ